MRAELRVLFPRTEGAIVSILWERAMGSVQCGKCDGVERKELGGTRTLAESAIDATR
jgi:hypothetical protein